MNIWPAPFVERTSDIFSYKHTHTNCRLGKQGKQSQTESRKRNFIIFLQSTFEKHKIDMFDKMLRDKCGKAKFLCVCV